MVKKIISVVILLSLLGCTGHIRENSFITQDSEISNYLKTDIDDWQKLFPQHKIELLNLVTQHDATNLQGLFLKHPSAEEVILYIPGNGMKVTAGGIHALQTLVKLDKSIVIFDRRGLGASSGKASIATLIKDSVEQYQFIRQELQAKSIIVHGYSLGSFIAGQLAKQQPIDALVLEGSATNVDDWIDKKTPWYVKPFLTVEVDEAFKAIDNKVVVSRFYRGPLLVIGGENDNQVPVELSEVLFNASQSKNKRLIIAENADHGSMLKSSKNILIYQQFLASITPR